MAADVCRVLEIRDVAQAVERLEDDEKLIRVLHVSGQNRRVWTVNEPGLYSLILRSNKSEARAFKRWITHEVLPAIRRTGAYAVPEAESVFSMKDNPNIPASQRIRLLSLALRFARMGKQERDAALTYYGDFCRNMHLPESGKPARA